MWFVSTLVPTARTASQQKRQAILSVVTGATAAAVWCSSSNTSSFLETGKKATGNQAEDDDENESSNPIEVNLMDKIANKIYLNPSRARLPHQQSDFLSTTTSKSVAATERPLGVPSHLRILAIDLPQMRHKAFAQGDCRVAFDRVYPNGIAPPKRLERGIIPDHPDKSNIKQKNPSKEKKKKKKLILLEVEQKAWVKSMIRCFQKDLPDKVGVEMMEASFVDLNPQNLRTTRQVGSYHYDPGKYTHQVNSTSIDDHQQQPSSMTTNSSSTSGDQHVATPETEITVELQEKDELDAPWNQYAWFEEVKLRVSIVIVLAQVQPSAE
jgi:hypothetical protein